MANRGGMKRFRAASKELGLLSEKNFFIQVGNNAGYIDPLFAKRVYNAMLDIVYKELREKGAIRFPQLCDFYLVRTRPKRMRNHNMVNAIIIPPHNQIKIRPMYSVRRYFKALSDNNPDLILDPTIRMNELGVVKRAHSRHHKKTE